MILARFKSNLGRHPWRQALPSLSKLESRSGSRRFISTAPKTVKLLSRLRHPGPAIPRSSPSSRAIAKRRGLMVRSAYRKADEFSLAAVAPKGRQEISLISIAIAMEESPVRVKLRRPSATRAMPVSPQRRKCLRTATTAGQFHIRTFTTNEVVRAKSVAGSA